MSGTVLAQIIPLLTAPILSRIYSPEDFGRLAIYLSIVQILGAISNGRYELAIVLPEKDEEGVRLTILSILIPFGFSLVTLVIVLLFSHEIASILGDPKLSSWLYLVPISILLIGTFNALNYYNTRRKNFKEIAKANISKVFGGSLVQLAIGFSKVILGGLIIGQVMSHLFGNVQMLRELLKSKSTIKSTKIEQLGSLSRRYSNFPKFSMFGIFLNKFSTNISNFIFSTYYGLSAVGFYSFGFKYLGLPSMIISSSIGQVYMQSLSEIKDDNRRATSLYLRILFKLFAIGFLIFFPLYFFIENLFAFVFGSEWFIAGTYAKNLLPLFLIRFVFAPISLTSIVFEKQKLALLMQSILFAFSVGMYSLLIFCGLPMTDVILTHSLSVSGVYVSFFYIIYRVIEKKI